MSNLWKLKEEKIKENNEKRNIDLAILPSHDNSLQSLANLLSYPSWYLGDTVGKSSQCHDLVEISGTFH